MMRWFGTVIAGGFVVFAHAAARPGAETTLLGFAKEQSASERELEARFDSALNRGELSSWMRRLSARPHPLGSPYDRDNAEFLRGLFTSWGFKTTLEEFDVLFPTPKSQSLELVSPDHYLATLTEPPLSEDSTSGDTAEQLPLYNAYSIDGDVTADLVYVNYGVPEDYDVLDRRGIDVKGKIVISRYGGAWRGIKPKVAAEHGAIGCIIYSDPRDDGYFRGDVYPKGAFRNDHGGQRGSVADMPLYPGDPLTPFVGATKGAKRLQLKDAATITKIPVLPISYADALPLLRAMTGPVAPEAWRGALPITYHLGPGPAKVRLRVAFNWRTVPAYDVVARLEGNERPDEWVIRGNHYDAWVNGAGDPISGLVALLAEARGVGALAAKGWRPRRSIVYAAWDGEEPGLIGSTEWTETHADELTRCAVAYVNTDGNGRGFLSVGGSPSLQKFVNEVGRDVTDPETNISVEERARARLLADGSPEDRKTARQDADLPIFPLGSGSDFTPFLQHLGIASLDLGYGGEGDGGSYHSAYDSYDFYVRFGDPTFQYGVALAQTAGRIVLRLADADLLPFEFTEFSSALNRYAQEIMKLTDDMRTQTAETNRMLAERDDVKSADPTKRYVPPKPRDEVPYVDFAPLQNALALLDRRAHEYEQAAETLRVTRLPIARERALDEIFMKTERALTDRRGLPRRPWFVHELFAPGFYTGYGVKTFPGVREAIEQRTWKEAEEQIRISAEAVERCADQIDAATALVASLRK